MKRDTRIIASALAWQRSLQIGAGSILVIGIILLGLGVWKNWPRAANTVAIPAAVETVSALGSGAERVENDRGGALSESRALVHEKDMDAQRRMVLEVKDLVRAGRIGAARTQAGVYYERWPNGPDIVALESLTGLHPTPPSSDDE